MSGHSKWKTIQHKKGAADTKRGKIFSVLAKDLTMLARSGGGNPDANAGLRTAIKKARAANMPADNIERAIKKGTGELKGVSLEEIVYEGYAAGGVGLVVNVVTDNRNRAAAEVRHIFTKHDSSFATQGSVSRNFQRKGQILVDAGSVDEETLMAIVLDAGAEDMTRDGDSYEIITDAAAFYDVSDALEKAEIETQEAEVTLIPDMYTPVADKAVASSVFRFISALEDHEDVQNVYSSIEVDDELLAEISED